MMLEQGKRLAQGHENLHFLNCKGMFLVMFKNTTHIRLEK